MGFSEQDARRGLERTGNLEVCASAQPDVLCRLPRPLTRKRGVHAPCTLRSTPSTGS